MERRTNKGFLQVVQDSLTELLEQVCWGGKADKQGFFTSSSRQFDRTAGTLLGIIQNRIAPGSIHSEGFASYNNIVNLPVNPPYQHLTLTVIHDQNFVDPVSGACTNRVQCYWKKRKKTVQGNVRRPQSYAAVPLDSSCGAKFMG